MSWAIWITGLPGSGKSAISQALARDLDAAGVPVTVLEMDVLRRVLTPAPTYSDDEREAVYRCLVYVAALLTDSGMPVIIDATGHRRRWRELARASIPAFGEVQLTCPLEICQRRERSRPAGHAPRGIYDAAGHPGATVPGVDVPYEPAVAPELVIDTSTTGVEAAVERILTLIERLAASPVAGGPERPRATWAMWLTGLPGSGKSTLAACVAEALAARELPIRVLEFSQVRQAIAPRGHVPRGTEEIIHRALVYAAKRLTEAGVPVIVDAAAPRRSWRNLARDLIAHFAEVQLVCPPEICGERERAVRWNLTLVARAPHPRDAAREAPEMVLDYEHSLNPELIVHTDLQDLWSATEEVLRLAERLHRAALAATRDT